LSIKHPMKKLLILIVFAAVYLHYYPQPKLTQWFEQEKKTLIDDVAEATDTQVRLNPQKILTDLKPELASFSPGEIIELKKITATRTTVRSFFSQYCNQQVSNPKIQQDNVKKICRRMRNYQSLF